MRGLDGRYEAREWGWESSNVSDIRFNRWGPADGTKRRFRVSKHLGLSRVQSSCTVYIIELAPRLAVLHGQASLQWVFICCWKVAYLFPAVRLPTRDGVHTGTRCVASNPFFNYYGVLWLPVCNSKLRRSRLTKAIFFDKYRCAQEGKYSCQ